MILLEAQQSYTSSNSLAVPALSKSFSNIRTLEQQTIRTAVLRLILLSAWVHSIKAQSSNSLAVPALSKAFSHIGYCWKPRSKAIQIKTATKSQRASVRRKCRARSVTAFKHTTDGKGKPADPKFHVKRQSMLGLRQKCAFPTCEIQGSYGVLDKNSTQIGLLTNSSSRKLFCRYDMLRILKLDFMHDSCSDLRKLETFIFIFSIMALSLWHGVARVAHSRNATIGHTNFLST